MWGSSKGAWMQTGGGKKGKGKGEYMPQKGYWDTSCQEKKNSWDNGPLWALQEVMEDKNEEVQFKTIMQRLRSAESSLQ
eukprot:2135109-Heterocapsa_arctica.AAC.1